MDSTDKTPTPTSSSWWTKSRRAANDQDYETWKRGGVCPTLNAFDNATESRATVMVIPIDMSKVRDSTATGVGTPATGIGQPGAPAYTLGVQTATQAVAILGDVTHALTAEGHDASEDGTGRGTPIVTAPAHAFYSTGGSHGLNTQPEVSPPLKVGSGLDIASPPAVTGAQVGGVRRLTPLECERLMGLPDNWTAGHADSVRYRQCGNAVVVPVAEWIGYLLQENA